MKRRGRQPRCDSWWQREDRERDWPAGREAGRGCLAGQGFQGPEGGEGPRTPWGRSEQREPSLGFLHLGLPGTGGQRARDAYSGRGPAVLCRLPLPAPGGLRQFLPLLHQRSAGNVFLFHLCRQAAGLLSRPGAGLSGRLPEERRELSLLSDCCADGARGDPAPGGRK